MAALGSGKHWALQGGERSLTGVSVTSEMLGLLRSCRITSHQETKLMLPLLGFEGGAGKGTLSLGCKHLKRHVVSERCGVACVCLGASLPRWRVLSCGVLGWCQISLGDFSYLLRHSLAQRIERFNWKWNSL